MRTPLSLELDIRQADAQLLMRREKLRNDWRTVRGQLRGMLLPSALAGAAGLAVGWALLHTRRPAASVKPRTSARSAALIAPLLTRMLTPALGREAATLVATVAVPYAVSAGPPPPQTAAQVVLNDYLGDWYEIARLPRRSERHRSSDVSVRYASAGGDLLRVSEGWRRRDGRAGRRDGLVRIVRGSGNARLRISFAPALLRVLPWSWREAWIIDVAPDYSAAVLGSPTRERLWLLGRSPRLDRATLERLLARAAAQGYDVSLLQPTAHRR
jgi:apolipoprotein D and lipocalin family protein